MLYTEVFCMRYYAGFSQIGSQIILCTVYWMLYCGLQEVDINGIRFWCYNAGHVLGAAMFMIEIAGVKVSNTAIDWLIPLYHVYI